MTNPRQHDSAFTAGTLTRAVSGQAHKAYCLLELIEAKRELVEKKLADYNVSESGCWEYRGHSEQSAMDKREGHSYGRTSIKFQGKSRKIYMHRLSYAYHHGVDPAEKSVAHKCDNSICICPGCLFLATHEENMKDMASKGRASKKRRCKSLTDAQALEIIDLIEQGLTNRQISSKYKVTDSTIRNIRTGQTWQRVTGIQPQSKDKAA